jgi:hypothetical protein
LRIQRRWTFEAGIAPTVEKEDARWNEGATVPCVSSVGPFLAAGHTVLLPHSCFLTGRLAPGVPLLGGAIDAFWMILFAVAWVRIPDRS